MSGRRCFNRYVRYLPKLSNIVIAHRQLISSAARVPCDLPGTFTSIRYQMIMSDCGSKQLPGSVMITDTSQATRLRIASIGKKVSMADLSTDTKAYDSTISVYGFNVDCICSTDAVRIIIP